MSLIFKQETDSDESMIDYESGDHNQSSFSKLCNHCQQYDDGKVFRCGSCQEDTHYTCRGYSDNLAAKVIVYYCKACRLLDRELRILWSSSCDNVETRSHELHLEAERILDHKIEKGRREFYIHWKDSAPDLFGTWEKESNLGPYYSLLQEYCENQNIPFSRINSLERVSVEHEPFYGGSAVLRSLMKTLNPIWHLITPGKIGIEYWSKRNIERDMIYLVVFKSTIFIILYYSSRKLGYVADVDNKFCKTSQLRKDLKEHIGNDITLLPRLYDERPKTDNLKVSLALISLGMARSYTDGRRPRVLRPSKIRMNEMKKWLIKPSD